MRTSVKWPVRVIYVWPMLDYQVCSALTLLLKACDVGPIALLDSGSQIPLISDVLFQRLNLNDCGHINVRGMFSKPICVPLADVIMKRVGGRDHDDVAEGLPVMCAVVSLKDVKYDVVLPPDIVANFNLMPVTDVTSERVNDNHVNVDYQTNDKHECVTSVMNVVDDDVSAGKPSSMTVSNDIKGEVDNVVQLLPSDEGRVESDVKPDVVHTVDNVVTGGVTCDDDAGCGDYDAGGGDCVAVTNCGDVIHAQNNLVELLFIVLLLLLKFTGRAVCVFRYMNLTLQPFRRYVPHFRMSDLVRNGDCVLYQV